METDNLDNDQQSLQQNAAVTTEELGNSDGVFATEKRKLKHNSMAAAASCRSAVQHAHLHIISNRPGDFAHSATNISYDL